MPCSGGWTEEKENQLFSLYTFVILYLHLSIFCIFLTTSHHISVSLSVCMTLSLLYVSELSSRKERFFFLSLGKILSGPASVTCTTFRNIILYMACRLLASSPFPWLGNDFPTWRCLYLKWTIPVYRASLVWSGFRGNLFLIDPKRQIEFPLALGSLIGGIDSHSSQPTCPAQSSDGTAEVKFSEDRAPLSILDDTFFSGHCTWWLRRPWYSPKSYSSSQPLGLFTKTGGWCLSLRLWTAVPLRTRLPLFPDPSSTHFTWGGNDRSFPLLESPGFLEIFIYCTPGCTPGHQPGTRWSVETPDSASQGDHILNLPRARCLVESEVLCWLCHLP